MVHSGYVSNATREGFHPPQLIGVEVYPGLYPIFTFDMV